ncbi:MAG TPA: hypothetical protein DCQ99_03410 [Nitrospinae bacterium]|uniref:Uncharacterized protein n=1 Tax=Candidatus Schekmanbacteria bacterium RBG_16_38_10 TaxID=1817879 RepID=A0A1F7RVP8_9BACT|nr:MAG: hypothetical protein A2W05_05660 [Candidatus Schekmanbacteria bacterium RBG_16_38_10]HAP66861.1 hypothetical protein [Nitrospinota bacterium]HBA27345.1 hypothetical protein [Nitrospinota bacterium]
MSVTFNKDSNILTFPSDQNREYPLNDAEGQKGNVLKTKAEVICVDVHKSSNPKQIPLSLSLIDGSFYSNLMNWFLTVCKGMTYKFQYTNDVTGESGLYVRWLNGFKFSFDGLYYKGEIILEKEL